MRKMMLDFTFSDCGIRRNLFLQKTKKDKVRKIPYGQGKRNRNILKNILLVYLPRNHC